MDLKETPLKIMLELFRPFSCASHNSTRVAEICKLSPTLHIHFYQ